MRILSLLFSLTFVFLLSNAQNITYLNGKNKKNNAIELTQNQNDLISFSVHINAYELTEIKVDSEKAYSVKIPNGISMLESTCPDLSKLTQSLIIPDYDEMEVITEGLHYIDIENVNVAPSKGTFSRSINPKDVPYKKGEVYRQDAFYPGTLAELNDPYILRDFRGQTVNIYPFQYNPISKILRIYTEINVIVKSTGNKGTNVKSLKKNKKVVHAFEKAYQDNFLNYKKPTKYDPVSEEGDLLIISPNQYYEQIKELVDWKNQKGIPTTLVNLNDIGSSNVMIQDYVEDYYTEKGLTFLLLIGDAADLPPLTKNGDSDAAYGHIEGNDSYAEVIVGRFSVESEEELQTMINKTIYYEKFMDDNNEWLNSAIGIASSEGGSIGDNQETDIEHMDVIRDSLMNFGYAKVDQIYDPGAYALQVIEALNEGRSVMNYVGHGDDFQMVTSHFNVSAVEDLENYNKYPYVFDVACLNGNFKGRTCFAEAFMRAKTDSSETGAVAIIASTILQDWAPPMNAQDEMVNILTESYDDNINRTFGGITINGCMRMNDNYGSSGSKMTDTWTIFGDPTVNVRTQNPTKLEVTHPTEYIIGMNEFQINCNTDGLRTTISLNDTILASKVTKDGGVILDLSSITELNDVAILTITGYNKVTYIDTIDLILSDAPYLVISELVINDSDENNNNEIEYGETLNLGFTLKNLGLEKASNVYASISDTTGYITYHDNNENQLVGSLEANQELAINDVFTITLSKAIVNQTIIPLDIIFTDGDQVWNQIVYINVNAPDLEILPFLFTTIEGSFNQRIDAGDTIEFIVPIVNRGDAKANLVDITADVISPYVNYENNIVLIDSIAIADTAFVKFNASINTSTPDGELASLSLTANTGIAFINNEEFIIGQEPVLNMGDGTESIKKYPFYNYYHSNKTQILYTADELGLGEKTLNSISFMLDRTPTETNNLGLTNFTISLIHTNSTDLTANYASMDSATEVLYSENYIMPNEIGEVTFDILPFEYNGSDNLIVELSWGKNDYFDGSNYFKTIGSLTENNSVAYGYKDNTENAPYVGSSNVRPNTKFKFSTDENIIQTVNFEVVNSEFSNDYGFTSLLIGGLLIITDEDGKASINLSEGEYNVFAQSLSTESVSQNFIVDTENQMVTIDMSVVSVSNTEMVKVLMYPNPATNQVTISAPNEDAVITIYDAKGSIVYRETSRSTIEVIQISDYNTGIYFVHIKGDSFSKTLKLFIE